MKKCLSDIEIARAARLKDITDVARKLGLKKGDLESYGNYKAKILLSAKKRYGTRKNGKYIVVTAMTPTPLGEGKTVTTIGLSMALNKLGKKAVSCIRQPSLGPVFGIKGGATGGGHSQVLPVEDINFHFINDTHAVGAANNLCAAFLDNSIFKGNKLNIDPRTIAIRRVLDVNDRSLRNIVTGLGKKEDGIPRNTGFDITAASEVMAILALAEDFRDLRKRIGKMVVALDKKGRPVTTQDLKVAGAMTVLLAEAVKPNLLQTLEGTPCLIHTGPFGNIAHGNSSIIADKIALKLADYVVTESGFGADCGAEKFFNIKCRYSGLKPDCAVVVCSVRALKVHGGTANLEKQIENVKIFGVPVVVAINKFAQDTQEEIKVIKNRAGVAGAECVVSELWAKGGKGGEALAKAVMKASSKKSNFKYLYPLDMPIKKKIETIATKIYGAKKVSYSAVAEKKIKLYTRLGFGRLPICMAKTHLSLTHDPKIKGRPSGFTLPITDIRASIGAGFLYPLCGEIKTMPGLPSKPVGERYDIDRNGRLVMLGRD